MGENEIVHKHYILSEKTYVFGPLQASKSRERYKKGLHPENMEKLTISNPGKITSDVSFFFREDANGTTYILDPPTMTLGAGERQVSGRHCSRHVYTALLIWILIQISKIWMACKCLEF